MENNQNTPLSSRQAFCWLMGLMTLGAASVQTVLWFSM